MSTPLLREMPLFADLADEDLERLDQMAEKIEVRAGQQVIAEGSEGGALYIVLDGELEVTRNSGGQDVRLRLVGPREFVGEMALIGNRPRSATVRAADDSRLLMIDEKMVKQLISTSPSAALALLRTVMMRLESAEGLLVHHQKMASLGTLAAGIAHELNNPAAAVSRSASQLGQVFADWERAATELGRLALDEEQMDVIDRLRTEMTAMAPAFAGLDALTRSEREDELVGWLEDHRVPDAWDVAATLVDAGWDVDRLETLSATFTAAQLPNVIRWCGSGFAGYRLLAEIRMATARISDLVRGVKAYANLDRAPVQEVDVHEGIGHALILLRHKLGQVRVIEEYDQNLPRIEAYPSDLNQVWTNLIDNALDSMAGTGTLTIRTSSSDESVIVEISDTGPGIPPSVQERIFDPFFTTKAPGVGTGLGLHISYSVVVERHHGQIDVSSQPGMTRFRVTLPVHLRGPED